MKKLPAASLLLLSCLTSAALAVKTQYFTQTTSEDFAKGTTDGVVVSNHGQVKLSRQVESLLPADQQFDAIPAIAQAKDGAIVFGTFPDSKVMRLKDGKLQTLATFDSRTITAIAVDAKGRVLVALAGTQAEVVALGELKEKPTTLFKQEGVDYVWSIVPADDHLLLGTGPDARIFSAADGKVTEIAKLSGHNVLSLLPMPDGTIYAGTDDTGFVYKIDARTHKPFVLFDAGESEISALALDAQGNLLAATSETRERAELPVTPEKPAGGKPEKAASPAAIDSKPPAAPKPPEDAPGNPIPKESPAIPEVTGAKSADAEPATEPAKPNASAGPTLANANAGSADAAAGGNAVYRIDKNGFVTELFRGKTIIYTMAVAGQSILIGTGDSGEIYELHPDTEEASVIARADAEQVTAIVPSADGTLLCATSNSGGVLRLSGGFASQGSYLSDVLDATVPCTFGTLQLRGSLPEKTSLTVQTRSGNVADPEKGGWSDWSAGVPAKEFTPIVTPVGRYAQYKVTLATTDATKTPAVDEVMVAYQKPNIAPRIASITVVPAGDPQNPGNLTVTWDASDPNEDDLRYTLYARQPDRGGWVALAENIAENSYTWSGKHTADGQYELKVVATDARSNPAGQGKEVARVSDGLLIDNTPPAIGDVKLEGTTVTLRVVDRAGTVASVEYAVDSTTHWQKSLPDDTMADSPEERYTLALMGLAKGQHTLTVRATDDRGNAGYERISVNVP